jgi:hypothetical protein
MIQLPLILSAWEQPDFEEVLRESLAKLGRNLPLQAGLTAGSYALEEPMEVMVISTSETDTHIEARVGIFYESLTPGCACAGDPTVESEQNEHVTMLVSINKQSAETSFQLLEE